MAVTTGSAWVRVRVSLQGAFASLLAVPLIMRLWAPEQVVLWWIVAYLIGLAAFVGLRFRTENPRLEFAWSIVNACLFAAVPLSAIGATTNAVYAAGAIIAFALMNEMATRGYLVVGDWRLPAAIMGISLVVAATIQVGWGIGLGALVALIVVTGNAHEVREEAAEIRYERDHDELTGLLNRRGLFDALAAMPNEKTIIMFDGDRFKLINDTYGYDVGDAVLEATAAALRDRLGPTWRIARQGGDEFVAAAPGHPGVPNSIAAPVTCHVAHRSSIIAVELELSAGIAIGAADGSDDVDALLSRAGFALRASKRAGERVCRFDKEQEQRFTDALQLSTALAGPESIFPFAQPITDGERVVGWELLARWRGEGDVIRPPSDFLPLLAENGLVPALNDRMLAAGVAFAAATADYEGAPFVSVNITASHLANPSLVDEIGRLLDTHEVDPQRLMVEITESEGLAAFSPWAATAEALVDLGVGLAIDDFGSGYSSLERMQQMPITHLKLDRGIATSLNGPFREVIRGIVRYGADTGLAIVAEGIENETEYRAMREIGVGLFQGYHFGKPTPLAEIIEELATASPSPGSTTRSPEEDDRQSPRLVH